MSPSTYQVRPAEPGILTEIFLAKRAEFQSGLYQTLTAGLRRDHLRSHFLEADPRKRERIRKFLDSGWTVRNPGYTDEEIREFPRLFFGYSLYEVDGVFLKTRDGQATPEDRDEEYRLEEERAQVIRIIFRYDSGHLPTKVVEFCRAALRDPLSEIGTLGENYPDLAPRMDPEVTAELERLDRWIRYAGLFLFGYLIFEICETIIGCETVRYGQRDLIDLRQDEVWVTSLWNLNMNVVRWTDAADGRDAPPAGSAGKVE